jgi:hypothetical protein
MWYEIEMSELQKAVDESDEDGSRYVTVFTDGKTAFLWYGESVDQFGICDGNTGLDFTVFEKDGSIELFFSDWFDDRLIPLGVWTKCEFPMSSSWLGDSGPDSSGFRLLMDNGEDLQAYRLSSGEIGVNREGRLISVKDYSNHVVRLARLQTMYSSNLRTRFAIGGHCV